MTQKLRSLLVSAFLLTTLSACVVSGNSGPVHRDQLAEVPSDLRTCFNRIVPAPRAGALSKKEVFALIAALKKSEAAKSQCGQRLIQFYEAQR